MSLGELLTKFSLADLVSVIANQPHRDSVADGDNNEDALMVQKVLDMVSTANAIKTLSDGNPGARSVLTGLGKISTKYFAVLEQHEVTGNKIWCLYKDLCGQDLKKLVAALEQLIGGTAPADLTVDGKKFTDCVDE